MYLRKRVVIGVTLAIALSCGPAIGRADESVDTATAELTPRQQAIADRLDRLRAEYAQSSDLRLRILYSTSGDVEVERRPDNGFYARETISAAELYVQARGSTDPLVLDLRLRRCSVQTKTMDACDRMDLARRWTQADTQNQVAWLTLASVLKYRGDLGAARIAFLRAAQASRWHEHYSDIAQLVVKAMPGQLSPQLRNAMLQNALAQAGAGIPFDALRTLGAYCKEDGEMRTACGWIVETMVRDTDTLVALTISVPYAVRARMDPSIVATYQREADAIHWSIPLIVSAGNLFDDTDNATSRTNGERLQALIDVGERRRGEQVLLEQRIGKSEAAARYVAGLSQAQLKHRVDILAQQ